MKQSVYNKYPDLLRVGEDATLIQLVDELDKLCRQPQPPTDLVNLSIAHSLQAREAESYAIPLPKPGVLRNIARPVRPSFHLPHRWFLLMIIVGVVLLTGLLVFFGVRPGGVDNGYYDAAPQSTGCRTEGNVIPEQEGDRTIRAGCYELYIPQVRVDNDRITVGYLLSANGMPVPDFKPFNVRLLDGQGNEIKRLGGISNGRVKLLNADDLPTRLSKAGYDMLLGANGGEEWFDSSSLSGSTLGSQVRLQLEIGGFSLQLNSSNVGPSYGSLVIQGPFKFELNTAYQNTTQVDTLNLADTVANQTVTLEKVVRRPDITRLYLRGLNTAFDFDLNAAGLYLTMTSGSTVNLSGAEQTFAADGLTVIQINNSLQARQGEWRLILRPASLNQDPYNVPSPPQIISGGPWFFNFQVSGTAGTGNVAIPPTYSGTTALPTVIPVPPTPPSKH